MTSVTASTVDVTPTSLRSQLARWPTGVTIITACGDGRPLGKTANSFHAASLDPALVGWCIDKRSSRFDEWVAVTGYAVHVMAGHQTDLVTRFAASGSDRFDGLDTMPGLDGIPLLACDVPLRLECRIADTFDVGDHVYLIGQVVTMTASHHTPMTIQR
ncbi:flavin reductase [Xylanimonas allomyrinae]|uniref:Flavin reductase n=1 Tax=Xylanimonas allomyrinae TaxID=2509459 RepID=A0A4P6EVA1_9MICO|nr:flavin reductase family protein [Xylanimonas allomyrinae]QAY64407.1 flavin reductase [Xylanimonas allomyrinae]